MDIFADLWLPILLSAVFVFIVSSVIHMAVQWHKNDCGKLPDEDAMLAAMREHHLEPGAYTFPRPPSFKECSTPEMLEKYRQGPVGHMIVLPSGAPAMGKALVFWFIYSVVIGAFVAYTARLGLAPGAEYSAVFRLTFTAGLLGYALPTLVDAIWKGQSCGTTFRFFVDGVAYALVTAGTFGWLWPGLG